MSPRLEKLLSLLRELFQLDRPELDFGLYRIMHAKSAEVTAFLEQDLLPQVTAAFAEYRPADRAKLENEMAALRSGVERAGLDPEQAPEILKLEKLLKEHSVDVEALENEVYDHLFTFFRRYYLGGDFLGRRVYKEGVYAIPYAGEDVKLHWANADQYYIKSSEHLRDYSFRVPLDDESAGSRVHFELQDAAEGEHGDVQADDGKRRVFILAATDFLAERSGKDGPELVVRFEYRPAKLADRSTKDRPGKKKPPTQEYLLKSAEKRVLASRAGEVRRWKTALREPYIKSDGSETDYSSLRAHLRRYAARNMFDHFIHKDLSTFLRRELDFYIKNELMRLDDVEHETAARVEQYLSKIRVVRRIAGKIISFLTQIEEFQKKLWLKQKFVYAVDYCVSLSEVPEGMYEEIAATHTQLDEWRRLGLIEEDSVPASKVQRFFEARPSLMLDTRHFDESFVSRLLDSLHNLDDRTDGLLVNGDNFHALRLLRRRHAARIKCAYIDPPYNTGSDGFLFRDSYRHSSWITMIQDRLQILHTLMGDNGVLFASIDANERNNLCHALAHVFGQENRVEEVIWVQNTTKSRSPTYSTNHEYVEVFAKSLAEAKREFLMFREPKPGLVELKQLIDELNPSYPSLKSIESRIKGLYAQHRAPTDEAQEGDGPDEVREDWKGLYQYKHAEYRDGDGRLVPERAARQAKAQIWVWRESDVSMPQVKKDSQNPDFRDKDHPTFRFYRPKHPKTKKLCPPPKRGWAWPLNPYGPRQSRSFNEIAADNRIVWGDDETKIPQTKTFIHETESNVAKSVVQDFTDGEKELAALFGVTRTFSNPKPSTLIRRFVQQTTWSEDRVIDCFAGSGTTGQAVIEANREDGLNRQFILVEAGDHFDRVLVPRIKKVAYRSGWKRGRPRSAVEDSAEWHPRIVKIIRLESFEDTLNNLEITREKEQSRVLALAEAQEHGGFKEQYMLGYMLNVETRDSASLLNCREFVSPTDHRLKIKERGSVESRDVSVDLAETFNWLIGLNVHHIGARETFSADVRRDSENRLRLEGALEPDVCGLHTFRTIVGTGPDARRVIVVWRTAPQGDEVDDRERANLVLNEWFVMQGYGDRFDLVYVNGDNNLASLKGVSDVWQVRLIEDDFRRLMFEADEWP
jgi:adenine-specific DNA-methyltransferase